MKKVYILDESISSKRNGIGTYTRQLVRILKPVSEVCVVSFNSDSKELAVVYHDGIRRIMFPPFPTGNYTSNGDIISVAFKIYIGDDSDNLIIASHSPCSDFLAMIREYLPFSKIIVFDNLAYVTQAELESLEKDNYFGPFISTNIKENDVINTSSQKEKSEYEPEIEFKLFNLIPIKSKKVKIIKEDKVLAGGTAIGLVLKTDGVLIVGSSLVSTPEGEVDVLEYDNLRIGDIIKQIENETVENVSSISKIINEEKNKGKELEVKLVRKNKEIILIMYSNH